MHDKPVAVVTGAYRGLGYETCRQLAQSGYRVILSARKEAEGQAAAEALQNQGLDVHFHFLDVTQEVSIRQLANYILDTYKRLDALVNNAGIFPDPAPWVSNSTVFDADLETIRTGFETNTLGPLPAGFAGKTLHLAYAVGEPWDFTSNPVAIEIVP